MIKQSPTARLKINQDFYSLTIQIPSKKNWISLIFMVVWLAGWGVGETFAIREIFNSGTDLVATVFLFVWLTGWTVGGAVVFYFVLWQLIGHEIITIERGVLTIKKSVIGIGQTKKFEIKSIKNMDIGFTKGLVRNKKRTMSRTSGGKISFDYKMKTIKFAKNINEEEARIIVEKLKENTHFNKDNFA
jgi:hypothetical protein